MKRSFNACASPAPNKRQPRKIRATTAAQRGVVTDDGKTMPPPGPKARRAAATTLRQRMKDAKVNALGPPFKYVPPNKRDGKRDKDSDDEKERMRPRKPVADADAVAAAPGAPHPTVLRGRDQAMPLRSRERDPSPGYDSRVSLFEAHQLMRKLEAMQLAPRPAERKPVVRKSKDTEQLQQLQLQPQPKKKTGHRPSRLELQDSNRVFNKDSAKPGASTAESASTGAPALNNFALANILKECKPDDYKAIMWERAAKLSKSNDPKDVWKAQTWLKMHAHGGWEQNFLVRGPAFQEPTQMIEGGQDVEDKAGGRDNSCKGSKSRVDKARAAHLSLQTALYRDNPAKMDSV